MSIVELLVLVALLVLLIADFRLVSLRRRMRRARRRSPARRSGWSYLTVPHESDARASEGRCDLNALSWPLELGADLDRLSRQQVEALLNSTTSIGRRRGRMRVWVIVGRRRGRTRSTVAGAMTWLVRRRRRRRRWVIMTRWSMRRTMRRAMGRERLMRRMPRPTTGRSVTWRTVMMVMMMLTTLSTVQRDKAVTTVKLRTEECPEAVDGQESDEKGSDAFQPTRKHTTASTCNARVRILTNSKVDVILVEGPAGWHVYYLLTIAEHWWERFFLDVHDTELSSRDVRRICPRWVLELDNNKGGWKGSFNICLVESCLIG